MTPWYSIGNCNRQPSRSLCKMQSGGYGGHAASARSLAYASLFMFAMSNPPLPAVPWTARAGARPRAYLLGSGDKPNLPAEAQRLRPIIDEHVEVVLEDFHYQKSLTAVAADLA